MGVAVRGGNGALYYKHTSDGGATLSPWMPLDDSIVGAPSVTSKLGGIDIEIFARGTDNALWHKSYDPIEQRWMSWESLGGGLSSFPAAESIDDPGVGYALNVYIAGTTVRSMRRRIIAGRGTAGTTSAGRLHRIPDRRSVVGRVMNSSLCKARTVPRMRKRGAAGPRGATGLTSADI
jgi:Repeat of unknown function (DUF346)